MQTAFMNVRQRPMQRIQGPPATKHSTAVWRAVPSMWKQRARQSSFSQRSASDIAHPEAAKQQQQQQQQQQGRVMLTLQKPVGIVFAQNKDEQGRNGPVFVEEIMPGSNAEKSGQIQVGDVVSQCSAVVLKAGKEGQYEKEGYGQRPYDNWETILIDCEGKEFKTVMNALKSNNERWGIKTVTLVFRRPSTQEAELCKKQAC